jgi:hypothetical protein
VGQPPGGSEDAQAAVPGVSGEEAGKAAPADAGEPRSPPSATQAARSAMISPGHAPRAPPLRRRRQPPGQARHPHRFPRQDSPPWDTRPRPSATLGYLAAERGLRPESIVGYWHQLARFEAYLGRIGGARLQDLSSAIRSPREAGCGARGRHHWPFGKGI